MTEGPEKILDQQGSSETFASVAALKYPSRFGLLTWPEIDFKPQSDMIIKGLIERDSSVLLYGDSGSGKTFLAGSAGFHVALGWPWFGWKVIQGGVIYIAAEGGLSMRRRVAAFRLHYNLRPDQDIPFALIPSPVNLLDPNADVPELLALIETVTAGFSHPLRLIEIDTVSRALAGGNENGPEDMGAFVKNLDLIRVKTSATILGVHHTGKDPSKGGRGHSLLRAAADTEIEVTKSETSGQSIVRVTKQRDGIEGDTFTFDLKCVELGVDDDGDAVTSCVVVPVENSVEPKPAKGSKRVIPADYLKALDYLGDVMADHSEIIVATGIPTGVKVVHVDRWRDHLKQRGLHDGTENGKKWFQRARSGLIANNRVAVDGSYVWIVKR
jgi:AAA domain